MARRKQAETVGMGEVGEVGEAARVSEVRVTAPVAELSEKELAGHCSEATFVQVRLVAEHSVQMRRLLRGLEAQGARIQHGVHRSGQLVRTDADVVRWLLERLESQ